jgi:predicted DNA-binding protein
MATKNPRINITLEETAAQLLTKLAKQRRKSISRVAQELIVEALERQEDIYFSALADTRDAEKKPRVAHKDAWK